MNDDYQLSAQRMTTRAVENLGREQTDFSYNQPVPMSRRRMMKVQCLECSTKFSTGSMVPTCPGCGGSDIDLQ